MAKILIGFMGAGKTTIANLLDPDFLDMDAIITEKIGMPIAVFFEKEGEAAFRQLETKTLENLAKSSDTVISTGGGVVENARNRQILAQNGETIYLKADFETLCKRIEEDNNNVRPLFINNSRQKFKEIFDRRQPLYEEAANIIIDVTNKTPQQILEEIK
ncbi:shikimate kinase [Streptococcus caviae]|uniref:shikimate kinase n=1 Tax=Streptococcus sp. 'caviae' TaxID=1915004 RepID=UPI00094BB655|nr:shikimate kinase [Streptococcus sp. 'caviae']OLN82750.1 shikimate kinase [Streptococcus sp. 'caviae']